MLEGVAEDKRFTAMLGVRAAGVGSVMDKGLHADWDEWVPVVVMMAIHMCVGRDAGICIRLMKEEQLPLNLGQKLAPKMHEHGGGATTEDADHVVFNHLDGIFSHNLSMVVGGDKFLSHCCEFDLRLVRK